jgi:branched-chain amino acid transport system substrate-binding protein
MVASPFRPSLKSFLLSLSLLAIFSACVEGHKTKSARYSDAVTADIQDEFDRAESSYRQQNLAEALNGFEVFLEAHPGNPLADEARYKIGKIHFLRGNFAQAHTAFTELGARSPDKIYQAKGRFMAGFASFRSGQSARALAELAKVEADDLDTKLRVQYYSILHEAALKSPDTDEPVHLAVLNLFDLYEEALDAGLRNLRAPMVLDYDRVRTLLDSFVVAPMQDVPAWLSKYPLDRPARQFVDYKLGRLYAERGNNQKAIRYLRAFVDGYPKNSYSKQARQLLAQLEGGGDASEETASTVTRIGILVPLSGAYATYGREVLEGVRCAAGACSESDSAVELVIEDSGESTESLTGALVRLEAKGVRAIIGPLTGPLAAAAGQLASGKHLPIFPITQKSRVMNQGDYIFQIGYAPEQQVKDLVATALNQGLHAVGIFYPDTNYGKTMANLFSQMATDQGIKVAAMIPYGSSPGADVDRLVQASKTPEGDLSFEALFVPDGVSGINRLAPLLAAGGVSGIPLLGTIAWDDSRLSPQIGGRFPGSFYVGVYDASGHAAEKFVTDYQGKFGRRPSALAAFGFDTVGLIQKAANKSDGDLRAALDGQTGINGVTGLRGFKGGQGPVFESKIIRIIPPAGQADLPPLPQSSNGEHKASGY